MSQIFKLFRLQQIDSQLDGAHARLNEIERLLSNNETLRQAQTAAESSAKRLQEAQKDLRRAEENVSSQRIKIEQTEAALYGGRVRNPKELQDMQLEAASLKKYLSVLEDRQLDNMLAVEEAENEHQAAADQLSAVETQSIQENASLLGEATRLRQEVERLGLERQAIASSIPDDELRLYEQLRQQRRGVAVAKIKDNCCSACGSTLNASLLHAARASGQITRCDSCGRILYSG
jgi:predicted  nucleic acid-binding Zn-ribbon protein